MTIVYFWIFSYMIITSRLHLDQFSFGYGTCLSISIQQQLVESYYRFARTNTMYCTVCCHGDDPPFLAIGRFVPDQIDKTRVSSLFYSQSHFTLCIISSWQQPSAISHYITQLNVNYKQLLSIR